MLINKTVFYVAEAASLLSLSSQKIYSLIYSGELGAYKISGQRRWNIPEEAIQDFKTTCMREYARKKRSMIA